MTAQEFGDIFRTRVRELSGTRWDWDRHMKPWLADAFMGARFGDPQFDWSKSAARELADEFIAEASVL